jgi:hypothetical protein
MITHGTPPVADGGWSEFIKNFRIGLRGRCLRTSGERACYHFATQLPDTGLDKTGLCEFRGVEKPNKQGLIRTARYRNGRLFPNFKTGALNHSATLPSWERQRLSKAGRAAKEASVVARPSWWPQDAMSGQAPRPKRSVNDFP